MVVTLVGALARVRTAMAKEAKSQMRLNAQVSWFFDTCMLQGWPFGKSVSKIGMSPREAMYRKEIWRAVLDSKMSPNKWEFMGFTKAIHTMEFFQKENRDKLMWINHDTPRPST